MERCCGEVRHWGRSETSFQNLGAPELSPFPPPCPWAALRFQHIAGDVTTCCVGPRGISTFCLSVRSYPGLCPADHQPSTWGMEREVMAEGQYKYSDLLLSATLAGLLA